jgi:hypothetical protein
MPHSEPTLYLGGQRALDGSGKTADLRIPPHHLTTHACIVGATGSGKTGMLMVLVEEVLRAKIPVLLIDVKGDLANLLLTFSHLDARSFAPWIDAEECKRSGRAVSEVAHEQADGWKKALDEWDLGAKDVAAFHAMVAPRVLTPGTSAGETLNVLSSLEIPSPLWDIDVEAARIALSASISLLLRLVGRDPDPTKSRDHVVLSILAEKHLRRGKPADVATLLHDLADPPVTEIGSMALDEYLPERERHALATALNTLLASPTFESWRTGSALDVAQWFASRRDGRVNATIVSVAHLDDDERNLVLGVVLDELLAWVRTQPGTSSLRALVAFDEVYGFLPPHPANPPAKRPLITLLKQARAFGVGLVVATQNPMDMDYRALSNAGMWFVGRLQTDADRARVVEGLVGADGSRREDGVDEAVLKKTLKSVARRWFVMRDVNRAPSVALATSRCTLCWLRGPMTRVELKRVRAARGG